MNPFNHIPNVSRCLVPCLIACALAWHAPAFAEQQVAIARDGETTTLVLPEYKSQGVPYASFADIARQLGGRLEVGDTRAVLEIGADRIEAALEGDTVEAGGETLALEHPVRRYHDDALLAFADLLPVLREGFGFQAPGRASPEPEEEPVPPAYESMEDVGLESITLPDPVSAEPETPSGEPAFGGGGRFLLAIDPGHGGEDTGAVGPNGLPEKELCLAVAHRLRRVLKEEHGIATVTTREQDETLNLQARQGVLARERPDLVLSIHGSTSYAPAAAGPVVFAHTPASRRGVDPVPARAAAQTLAAAFDGVTGAGIPPVHEVPLRLFREYEGPALLVELGNLLNPDEAERLADAGYQAALADALAGGISRLLERSDTAGESP